MSEFTADYAGIGEMLKAPFMAAEMRRRAELGKVFAEAIAPFDLNGVTQHYKESFAVHVGDRTDRAEAILENDDDDAIYVEFGTGVDRPRPQGGSSPRHRVLGRALDIMGAG